MVLAVKESGVFFLFIETFSLSAPLSRRMSSHFAVITVLSTTP